MMKKLLVILLSMVMLTSCGLAEEDTAPADAGGASPVIHDAVEDPAVSEGLSCSAEQLVHMLARYLAEQDYTLDILTAYDSQTVRAGSSDGETIRVEVNGKGRLPVEILLDGTKVTVSDRNGEEVYTYGEGLDLLLFGTETANAAGQLLTPGSMFDERDLDFLARLGEQAVYELMNAGAIPVVKQVNGDIRFSMSLTPDLILNAGVRLAEQLQDYEPEIDLLLNRLDPLLRRLIPDMYEDYDPETGMRTEREAYTFAELRPNLEAWMAGRWLRDRIEFEGMHLDVNGFIGDGGWRVDAGFFMPGSDISVWFGLNGDETGSFEGLLEYCSMGYSRVSERREIQSLKFSISGTVTDSGISVRVRPETPMQGFTGLRIDCMSDFSGMVVDAVTDALDFRIELSENLLDMSLVTEELLLDAHLSGYGGIPRGSLIYRDGWNGFYIKLNEVNETPGDVLNQPAASEALLPEAAAQQ